MPRTEMERPADDHMKFLLVTALQTPQLVVHEHIVRRVEIEVR